MRNVILWIVAVLMLLTVNVQILQNERLLKEGVVMLLELAPRDPRSLIQGDYMALRYTLPDFVISDELPPDGHIVVRLDDNRLATLVRLHPSEQKLAEREYLLRYRKRDGRVQLGSKAFFFQEGRADYYAKARYGELRVAASGDSVLVGLRGGSFQELGPPK